MLPGEHRDYLIDSPYHVSSYEIYDEELRIQDAVWGSEVIGHEPGDEIFLELVDNPLVTRLLNIEQLSLGPKHATMPNTTEFTRWESQWGSVVFVRKMTEGMDIDPRERTILQLRTFLSDLGHTAFSHVGDWLFQGFGGPEDQHDNDLLYVLEAGGVVDLLRKYGIKPEEVVFPETSDWIENESPDLCVDRVDYGVREVQRWLNRTDGITDALRPEAFTLDDGRIVMKNHANARDFAVAYSLLPTEHWAQPTHRLQLLLLQEAIKRMMVQDESLVVNWMDGPSQYHPRDYMYSVDTDFINNLEKISTLNWLLSVVMKQIGFEQRRIFSTVRSWDLDSWFDRYKATIAPLVFPRPLESISWHSQIHPLMPSNITLKAVRANPDQPQFEAATSGIDFYLPPLKPRYIDPLFCDDEGKVMRLSEHDPEMKQFFSEQAVVMGQAYKATLHMNDEFRARILEGLEDTQTNWPELLKRPRMEKERFAKLLGDAAVHAVPNRGVRLLWGR